MDGPADNIKNNTNMSEDVKRRRIHDLMKVIHVLWVGLMKVSTVR